MATTATMPAGIHPSRRSSGKRRNQASTSSSVRANSREPRVWATGMVSKVYMRSLLRPHVRQGSAIGERFEDDADAQADRRGFRRAVAEVRHDPEPLVEID